MKAVIVAVRTIRGELNLSPAKEIPMMLAGGSDEDRARLMRFESLIVPLAKLSDVYFVSEGDSLPTSSAQLIGKLEVHVPMAGLIDVDAEVARLEKQLKKLEGEIQGLSGKLNNRGFTDKAPTEVVERERLRLKDAQAQFAKIIVTISELRQG